MKRWKVLILSFLFLVFAGFLLGVLFLFFVSIPVEAFLSRANVAGSLIDIFMDAIILAWIISTLAVGVMFYRGVTRDNIFRTVAGFIIVGLIVLSSGTFYLLLSTDSAFMATFRGVVQTDSRFAYGPYPDEPYMRLLKQGGYTGVISLLSPNIPFEKVLLDKESEAAKRVGLQFYNFPMLPWVSDNKDALAGIEQLVKTNQSRFYIHCNLGQHRTVLVKNVIEETLGNGGNTKLIPYPKKLERGELHYFADNRIILGPYPTDSEWLDLVVKYQVKEVVSYLDPENPSEADIVEKEQKTCKGLGLGFKLLPVKRVGDNFVGTDKLIDYLKTTKDTTFVHGYTTDDKTDSIDEELEKAFSPTVN